MSADDSCQFEFETQKIGRWRNMSRSAMDFYNKCDLPQSPYTVKIGDGICVYKEGLPWDNKNAYELNIVRAKDYIKVYLGQDVKISKSKDDNVASDTKVVDGVKCVDFSAPPILTFCDIDEHGCPIGWNDPSDRPQKVCAKLKDDKGNVYFLPMTCDLDCKGHSWPAGLFQTFLANDSWNGDGYTLNISVQMNIELSSNMKDNLSGYDVVGFVVWKNE